MPPGGSVTVVGFSEVEGPLPTMGETVAVMFTLPVKPPMLDRVMLEVPEVPRDSSIAVALALSVKSGGGGGVTIM